MTANPIFCALDTPELSRAERLTRALAGAVGGVKVGLEFFTAQGREGVRAITALGLPVFLDLKFHDIPNTVAQATAAAAELGVDMLTVHASGGGAMLTAATHAARDARKRPRILAVTVLTSLAESDLADIGVGGTPVDQVRRLAALAHKANCDGVVCSPNEVEVLRADRGRNFLLVVPGIRPAGADAGDQKRTGTPAETMQRGASYLVVGRPITTAADPRFAALAIAAEAGALVPPA